MAPAGWLVAGEPLAAALLPDTRVTREVLAVKPFVRLKQSDSPYFLVVEKESQLLYLFETARWEYPLGRYICSTGQSEGTKRASGDLRTPVGIYYFTRRMEAEDLDPQYGIRAFVLDYPNQFDRLEGNGGSGIWLHATNTPQHAQLTNDTRGCVVVDNSTMEELSEYIQLDKTPILILQSLKDIPAGIERTATDLTAQVEAWRTGWETGDVQRYMAFYSRDFESDGMTRAGWQRYKRRLAGKYQWIRVQFRDISILTLADQAVVNLTQVYSSDQYSDIGRKRVYWKRENEKWRIVGEQWSPLRAQALAENEGVE